MPFNAPEPCGLCAAQPARPYISGWRCYPHAPDRDRHDERAWLAARLLPRPPGTPPEPAPVSAGMSPAERARAHAQTAAARAASVADGPSAFVGQTVTSAEAARKVLPKTGTYRRAVLDAIIDAHVRGHTGATDPELGRHLELALNTVRPRRLELVRAGLVHDSGHTRQHTGNAHTVWSPTNAALAATRHVPQ